MANNHSLPSFAVKEAELHRQRGVSLSMFLGLMKYYRQSYIDLIRNAGFAKPQEEFFRLCVDRYFDRIEIAFCVEWTNTDETKQIGELQTNMRIMTNEKNRFLTIFESIPLPIILLDQANQVENVNFAAAKLGNEARLPGANYYGSEVGKETIKDTGHGIAKENLGKIFDPYFTTKKVGSGLGLATAYSIVIKHNGHIAVESGEATGTCFHIYIPALPREQAHIKKPEKKTHFGKGKILIMDDDEMLRTVLTEMLNFLGYEALSSGDGKEAVNLYEGEKDNGKPFQAAIIDLTVPGGMGGKETIQEILKRDPDFKAVVSSGYSNDPVMAEYGNYGFKAVIKKPYDIEELSTVLQALVECSHGLG